MLRLIERIPASIRYPGLVLMFLAGSITGQVFLVRAAFTNGGPQIEQNYYQRSLRVEEDSAKFASSRKLGWNVLVTSTKDSTIQIFCVDAKGAPISGLMGEVVLRRPHIASFEASIKMEAGLAPGTYQFQAPKASPGLWDLEVSLQQGKTSFHQVIRSEW